MGAVHIGETQENAAVYYSKTGYRKNGHTFLKSKQGKGSRSSNYENTGMIQAHLADIKRGAKAGAENGSVEHAARYTLSHLENFLSGKAPYKNQAHHMLPQSFNKLLSDDINTLCKKVKYNINRGENIIFLPEYDVDGGFHDLPYHLGSHGGYNKEVLKDADKLGDLLKKYMQTEPCKDGEDIPEDIVNEFKNFEDGLWAIIIKAGKGNSIDSIKLPRSVNTVSF